MVSFTVVILNAALAVLSDKGQCVCVCVCVHVHMCVCNWGQGETLPTILRVVNYLSHLKCNLTHCMQWVI